MKNGSLIFLYFFVCLFCIIIIFYYFLGGGGWKWGGVEGGRGRSFLWALGDFKAITAAVTVVFVTVATLIHGKKQLQH